MAGEASCAFDKASCAFDEDSQDTPVGFHDTPSQWYTANHRKRALLSRCVGSPTQRDSKMTQVATEGARPLGESTVPVFVAAMPSQEEKDELGHEEDDVDEEETQIRMTNSEEQEGAPRLERKIVEETVPLPIVSAVSSASRSVDDAGMENSDDVSNMSDDMLEQDGSVVKLPEIAALFRQREEKQEVVQNRIYTPRASHLFSSITGSTSSLENQKAAEKNNEDDQHKSPQLADEITLDISEDKSSRSDDVKEASSRSALTVPRKSPTSRKCAKVIDSESTGSQSEGGSIRVILTGLEPTAAIRKRIKSITDADYESNIEKATHVVAPQNQLKRTVKLLCGISCCTHILGKRWLDQSARAGAAVDEQANCLHDEEAESKWQFDLRRTMYDVSSKQRQRLFAGYSVFITNHKFVLPPAKDLVKIVECAGGKASSKGKPGLHDMVISSEMALAAASVRKQLANANPERITHPS
ncbi:unnamed protein product [Peronospora destructor]|uniref:BRCT domain-containing protein n=1 Tax=Peronospora destructor TaxID=86335 RepID=A0AAV0TWS0_9STRA|nr:unnamed protein product [Peronospora destructor]